jgi:hypothetical protein
VAVTNKKDKTTMLPIVGKTDERVREMMSGMQIVTLRFELNERVECRNRGESWQVGTVVSVEPLMVQPDGDALTAGYRWDEVRVLCLEAVSKPPPQPPVAPLAMERESLAGKSASEPTPAKKQNSCFGLCAESEEAYAKRTKMERAEARAEAAEKQMQEMVDIGESFRQQRAELSRKFEEAKAKRAVSNAQNFRENMLVRAGIWAQHNPEIEMELVRRLATCSAPPRLQRQPIEMEYTTTKLDA